MEHLPLASLRVLGKSHFLNRVERSLRSDDLEDFRVRLEDEIKVRVATDASSPVVAKVGGWRLPIFGRPERVAGESFLDAEVGDVIIPVGTETATGILIGFDVWASFGALLSDGAGLPDSLRGLDAQNPVVDLLEGELLQALAGRYGPLRSPWPQNAPFALGLSHDVDRIRKTFQHVSHPLREARRGRIARAVSLAARIDPGAYWCFDEIKALERREDVISTFFFLHEVPPVRGGSLRQRMALSGVTRLDDRGVSKEVHDLASEGWEIALHSSSFAPGNPSRLEAEKRLLEGISEKRVNGVRQHFLAPVVSRLWPDQQRLRFTYDTTMGFSRRLGFRGGTCFPYFVGGTASLLELPFEIMDGALEGQRGPWSVCERVLDAAASVGGALSLVWHQRFFNEREYPGFSDLYVRLIRECRRRGAWIAPLGEIAAWWRGESQ